MKQREIGIKSNDNTLFVTEQCNNRCIMCCQPPKKVNDIDLYFAQNVERIKSAPKDLSIIGITSELSRFCQTPKRSNSGIRSCIVNSIAGKYAE